VREAELDVWVAENKLIKAQTDLDSTRLTAPFAGVVLDVKAQVGESVGAGAKLIQLSDPRAVEVKASVIEEDLPLIQAGQPVDLFFDARPDAVVTGRVARTIPQRLAGDRPLYPVYITLDNLPEGLAPGMTVDTSIVIAGQPGVLRLPRSLVRARSDGTAQVKVWVNEQVEKRNIKIGLRGDQYVEIVEGLNEGDLVVGQ
jgi:RND family efflux transporter MFP subunit